MAPGVRRLRAGGRRWTYALIAAGAMLGGCVALDIALDRAADDLLRTGVHGTGTVLEIRYAPRRSTKLKIEYVFAGKNRVGTVAQTSDRSYSAGDQVTVVTDPARPDRIRTVDEPNLADGAVTAGGVLLVAGVATFPIAVIRRARWARRLGHARRTGWHPAVVTVVAHRRLAADDHHAPDLEIHYRDGIATSARAAHAYRVAALDDRPRRAAWVAGTGENMSVLFPEGPRSDRPYLVPATEHGRPH